VTNSGSKSGTPTCTIGAQNSSYKYIGIGDATLRGSVAPGATVTFVTDLAIARQGALYVAQVMVIC
jgi:hypothetical protein